MERSEVDKVEIRAKVKQSYLHAKEFPIFMDHFKPAIQRIIDEYVPSSVTETYHVNADINHLAKQSKANGYNTTQFLKLITDYILMIIQAVDQGVKKLSELDQTDLFESGESE